MSEVNERVSDLENENALIRTELNNLKNIINANDILLMKQDIQNLKTNQIPITKIEWDIAPKRNLKQVLGNLDNIPYSNLRTWLEKKEPVWQPIS